MDRVKNNKKKKLNKNLISAGQSPLSQFSECQNSVDGVNDLWNKQKF